VGGRFSFTKQSTVVFELTLKKGHGGGKTPQNREIQLGIRRKGT